MPRPGSGGEDNHPEPGQISHPIPASQDNLQNVKYITIGRITQHYNFHFIWQNVFKLQNKMEGFHVYMELPNQRIKKMHLVEK
jgi:hypothetical protein